MSQAQSGTNHRGGESNGPSGIGQQRRQQRYRKRQPPSSASPGAQPSTQSSNVNTSSSNTPTIKQSNEATPVEATATVARRNTSAKSSTTSKPASTGPPPPVKKSKKPPQQLKTISLGDLIQPNSLPASAGRNRPRPQPQPKAAAVDSSSSPPTTTSTLSSTQLGQRPIQDMDFPELLKSVEVIQEGNGKSQTTKLTTPKVAWGAKVSPHKASTPSAKGHVPAEEKAKQLQQANNQKREPSKPATSLSPTKQSQNSKSPSSSSKQPPTQTNKSAPLSATKQLSKGSFQQPPKPTMVLTNDPNVLRAGLTTDPNVLRAGLDPKTNGQEFMKFAASAAIVKGRQRVKPRKKKFTTLKKKVLQERLNKWREKNPIPQPQEGTPAAAPNEESSQLKEKTIQPRDSRSIALFGFVHPDDDQVEDDDEYEELVSNLRDMAQKVGPTNDVFIPRQRKYYKNDDTQYPVFVRFVEARDAAAAVFCWNGLVLGGQALQVISIHEPFDDADDVDPEQKWHAAFVSKNAVECDDVASPALQAESTSIIILENLLTEDDLDDPDCLAETKNDAKILVTPFAKVLDLVLSTENSRWLEVRVECNKVDAMAVISKLQEVVVGGTNVLARLRESPEYEAKKIKPSPASFVELRSALSPDDFEDEDGLQESVDYIRALASQFGNVSDLQAHQENCTITIAYDGDMAVSENAAKQLDGMMLGGSKISAQVVVVEAKGNSVSKSLSVILLSNILTEDDIEDDECLEESLNDIKELALQYGRVLEVQIDRNENGDNVRVTYDGDIEVANKALSGFNGMLVGGQAVTAQLLSAPAMSAESTETATSTATTGSSFEKTVVASKDAEQMFSRGKRIPERFAECKRVPKIPNAGTPRHYARVSNDDTVKSLLLEMLEELTRLQRRAAEDNNAKARRRIVMGLREVARGIRAHKVKMVLMANNLDEYGVIDEKLRGILDLAAAEEVPVFFELGKRALGKAVGKTIKVGVVGIQNADGADQQFKKLNALSRKSELFAEVASRVEAIGSTA